MRWAALFLLIATIACQAQTPALEPPDSTKLKVSKYVKPVYPAEAAAKGIEGQVQVHLDIDEEGNVTKAEAVTGEELLRPAAVTAYKQWKFTPYIRNGHAVKVSTTLPMTFSLPPVKEETGDSSKLVAVSPKDSSDPSKSSPSAGAQVVDLPKDASNGFLIHRVNPSYPRSAQALHHEGMVVLRAIIGKDGAMKNLSLIKGDQEFAEAAMAAVKQWRYHPYVLQGQPVEVDTEITVNFTLSHNGPPR